MQSANTAQPPAATRERRWSLTAAIASITVFGLSVGQGAPLMSLLLDSHHTNTTLNGLNAGAAFIGVIIGPLLSPRCVRIFGVRNFLVACFFADIVLTLSLKAFDSVADWFVLRMLLGLIGSSIFTSSEAWINQLAGDANRGRVLGVYAAALAAGFAIGPLILSLTGIAGWLPFIANAAITASAMLPLLGIGDVSRTFGRERGASPLTMFLRAPLILCAVAIFAMYESTMMTLLPIWGVRIGLNERLAAATLTAVFFGSIVLQVAIGWMSDRYTRIATLRVCSLVGLTGAMVLLSTAAPTLLLFGLLFVWGGIASGIYPVALSMAGDRFRGTELVTVNAAMIIAYGLGALAGPPLSGLAMDVWNVQGLFWVFATLFTALLVATASYNRSATAAR